MLRELNINEMNMVSGGNATDEVTVYARIQRDGSGGGGGAGSGDEVIATGERGGYYGGATLSLALGVSAYVGADGAGEGNAGLGIGGSITFGRSNNTNQAVQDRANVDNTQICTAVCLSDLDLNFLDGDWHVSIGAGVFQPFISGGRSSSKE